jgi:sigma-B regulation protein RsbU (phosphoserine phosphatase)
MKTFGAQLNNLWRQVSWLDAIAALIALVGVVEGWFGPAFRTTSLFGFIRFLAIVAALYLLYRFWRVWRNKVLWSLRNRLIVAYLFIAVVPILLLVSLAVLAGQILYSQLGAYLLYEDIHRRLEMLSDSAANLAAAEETLPATIPEPILEKALEAQAAVAHAKELPGLKVNFHVDAAQLREVAGPGEKSFAGILQTGKDLRLVAMRQVNSKRGTNIIELSLPVTPEFLEEIAPDIGGIDVTVAQRVEGDSKGSAVQIGSNNYRAVARILTRHRRLHPAQLWLDPVVEGFSKLEATYLLPGQRVEHQHPVFAFFQARPSQLNRRIFASVGEFSQGKVFGFQLVSVVLLLIEIVALLIGVVLTRAITSTVADLYRATQFVQRGDLTHRVRVERRDQLGLLGESFNSMTGSISGLIEEQKQLQRLENEVFIAREVQNQLFPQKLPVVPGVEIEAICKAARAVSGDYYDFIELSPTQIAIAVADISGKGISAALLMASLQAALRSLLLAPDSAQLSTAEIVARLNNHLVRNTGDDRFATFFIGVYDSVTRLLRYTNAGHLPSFCIADGRSIHLDVGGMVLGIIEDYPFQEGSLVVPPNALLVGYSDGLVEPENVYGEEFGIPRLEDLAMRVQGASPRGVADALMNAVEEWSGTPDQADDMTVIVARLR